jgi:hypothetical protein
MIIWDEKDPWGPGRDDKCVLCRGQLQVPLVVWHPSPRGDDDEYDTYARFFLRRVLCRNMRRILTRLKANLDRQKGRALRFSSRKQTSGGKRRLFVHGGNE